MMNLWRKNKLLHPSTPSYNVAYIWNDHGELNHTKADIFVNKWNTPLLNLTFWQSSSLLFKWTATSLFCGLLKAADNLEKLMQASRPINEPCKYLSKL